MITAVLGALVAAFTTLVPAPNHPPYERVGRDAYSVCLQLLTSRMESAMITAAHPYPVDASVDVLGVIAQPFPSEYRFSGVRLASASQDISDACLRFLPPELHGEGGVLGHVGEPPRFAYDYSFGPGQPLGTATTNASGSPVDVVVG